MQNLNLSVPADQLTELIGEYLKGNFEARAPERNGSTHPSVIALNQLGAELLQRQKEIEREKALWQEVVRHTRDLVYTVNSSSVKSLVVHPEYVSPRLKQLLGCAEGSACLMPQQWGEAIHPEDWVGYGATLEKAWQGVPGNCEYRVKDQRSGEYSWVLDNIWPAYDDQGRVVKVHGAVRDIAERKMQEETVSCALKEVSSTERMYYSAMKSNDPRKILALLIESLSSIPEVTDLQFYDYNHRDGALTVQSRRFEMPAIEPIVPSAQPDSILCNILYGNDIVILEEETKIQKLFQEFPAVAQIHAQTSGRHDLSEVKMFAALPIAYGCEIFGLITFIGDSPLPESCKHAMSRYIKRAAFAWSQIEAENKLNARGRFLETILENVPVEIAVFDQDHKYAYVNSKSIRNESMRKWIIGKDDYDYINKRQLDSTMADKRRETFLKARETGIEQEWIDEHPQPDGSRKYVLRHYSPFYVNGELRNVIGYGVDITRMKNAQLEREQLVKELGNRINQLMQFNSVVSHNLRAPVASIMGLCNLLDMSLNESEKDEVLEGIQATAHSMDAVLRDLTNVLQAQSSINQSLEKVELRGIIEKVKNNLLLQFKESGAEMEVSIAEEANEITSIKSYLHSIMFNLVANAIKYRNPGRQLTIAVEAAIEGDMLHIRVKDNGLGIDLERHGDSIFGLYKRFHYEVGGQGLGLHLSKAQTETLGGTISVESKAGEGSCFEVIIPRQYRGPLAELT